MPLYYSIVSILGLALALLWPAVEATAEVERVVVLANANDSGSVEIAQYYAQQRGIPAANIIALKMPQTETVTVSEFVAEVYNPLLNALIQQGWMRAVKASAPDLAGRERVAVATHRISYLVTTRGVPLRIANDAALLEPHANKLPSQFQVNRGSVDSELALLAAPANVPLAGFVPNPLFGQMSAVGVDAQRVIRVSRLDGPSVASVKHMLDRTLQGEAQGLMGRAYFDLGGPHAKGDEWMRAASELAGAAFFDLDVDSSKRAIDQRDRYDAPAIYMGWYRPHAYGLWRERRWSVPPGAIAFHLHSFSATTVRSARKAWLGAFVAQGYCATVGNVYEPYLEYTHHPHRLLEALLNGHTFGAALMYSQPALSWQGVAIGDPLYRPFKVGLDAQLQRAMDLPLNTYVTLRQVQRLQAEDTRTAAIAFAREQFAERPSLALAYALAELYLADGAERQAVEVLKLIRYLNVFANEEVVLAQQIADLLDQHGESELALEVYQRLVKQPDLAKVLRIALFEAGAKVAQAAGESALAQQWHLRAQL